MIKYGGNAMTDALVQLELLRKVAELDAGGYRLVIVHGGGPFIREALDSAGIVSEFIDGHRRTSPLAMEHVEMALKGKVNGRLVGLLNSIGCRAVGLSGKDGRLVVAGKRRHTRTVNGRKEDIDLGRVGDVSKVDTALLELLLEGGFLPVIACLATDGSGRDYNINGDLFAGHIAGALEADDFLVLTDVDGLFRDIDDPASLMKEIPVKEISGLVREGVVQGGMLPKLEACQTALVNGAGTARIINGTKPEQLTSALGQASVGTRILK